MYVSSIQDTILHLIDASWCCSSEDGNLTYGISSIERDQVSDCHVIVRCVSYILSKYNYVVQGLNIM